MTAEIERLMKDDTAGDPISGIKWARKAAEKISLQLRRMCIWVSPSTVRRLLKKLDFHLHVNKKTICSTRSPIAIGSSNPSVAPATGLSVKGGP